MIRTTPRHTYPIALMYLWREITDDHDKVLIILGLTNKGKDAVLCILAIDPFKPIPVEVHLPERLVLAIKAIEFPGIFQHFSVHRILFHQMPIQAVIKIPLNELTELSTHEHQFLPRMGHPVRKEIPKSGELLPIIARHLADQGTFPMDHLIMGQRQYKILRKSIHQRKCKLILVPFPIDGIQADIIQHIIHPAHIPLIVEAHATGIDRFGYKRPGSGLLRNHQCLRMILEYRFIELLDELHGFQIATIPIFIRLPIAILPGIIQIKHIGHRIDTQAIDMELLQPKKCVGNQKALHFCTPIIKIRSSPFPVLCPLLIIRFIERLSIKVPQPLVILAKMAWHPVHDDRNPICMGLIHQILEILRAAIPTGHRIIAGCLIAPGTIIRMLTERHELQMGIMHILDIADQLICQIPIAEIATLQGTTPGTQMHLIRQHGGLIGTLLLFLCIPSCILPIIAGKIIYLRCRLRLLLRKKTIRIGLHDMRATPLRLDRIFIDGLLCQAFDEYTPYLPILELLHLMAARIPFIEFPYDTHGLGMRCPYSKAHPPLPILLDEMCPQHLIRMKIRSLMKQVQIELTKLRCLHYKSPSICPMDLTV